MGSIWNLFKSYFEFKSIFCLGKLIFSKVYVLESRKGVFPCFWNVSVSETAHD